MRRTRFTISGPILSMILFLVTISFIEGSPKQKGGSGDPKGVIQPFNYEGVQLLDGRLKDQFEQVKDFYFALRDNDLLKNFRERAGLLAPEGPDLGGAYSRSGLTFGQWLSAFARMYKITGDVAIRDKAIYLMDEWAKTIDGYYKPGHYVYDKDVQGLVDMYEYIGIERALHQFFDKSAGWTYCLLFPA